MNRVILTIVFAFFVSCEEKKENISTRDREHSGGPAQMLESSTRHLTDIRIPGKSLFPGVRSVSNLNRLVSNKSGESISIRLAFDKKSSDEVKWEVPEVRRGWIKVTSNDGAIRLLPGRKIEITKNGKVRDLVGVPGWMIVFSPSHGKSTDGIGTTCLYLCNIIEPIEPSDLPIFRLSLQVEKGVRYIPVSIEFSNDFDGSRGNWYVHTGV